MPSYIIEGGRRLEGEVDVSGSKNASLPILASSILNSGTTKLYNVPEIRDTRITQEILKFLGCKVKKNKGKVEVNSKNITKKEIPEHLMHQMRSTVILAGAILGRFKEVKFSYPGGCDIGARPIDLHLKSFEKLGVNITENAGFIVCKCDKIIGANIDLDFPSVGATENIILASVYAEGVTNISNAAMEPEIVDLANCLNSMGAKIEGAGTSNVKITGVKNLKSISYKIMPDRIEAGSLLCMTAITGGKIKLNNCRPEHIIPVLNKLEESGCLVDKKDNSVILVAPKKLKAVDIKTMPYPGFPSDMQSVFGAMLTIAKGTSVIVENIFEHGFTMDENDNKIWIKAFKCENDIVILVKDNGCGIDSEKREELNRILCERTRRISYIDEEEKSIGINNVNTRIKNYYGEKYGVKVNKADKGTEIQLLLGIENLEEENKDK